MCLAVRIGESDMLTTEHWAADADAVRKLIEKCYFELALQVPKSRKADWDRVVVQIKPDESGTGLNVKVAVPLKEPSKINNNQ